LQLAAGGGADAPRAEDDIVRGIVVKQGLVRKPTRRPAAMPGLGDKASGGASPVGYGG